MNIIDILKQNIAAILKEQFDIDTEEIAIQNTRKEFNGAYTFVVFPYLKAARLKPEILAAKIGEALKENVEEVKDFNIVKGFLNLEIAEYAWLQILEDINKEANFGQHPAHGQKVMVEYSSPNTNKPLHLGHLRNNFLGFSVSEILKYAGYDVRKVNLVNDRGIHICKSMLAYQRYGKGETPEKAGLKGDHLIGKYYVRFDKEYKKEIKTLMLDGFAEEEATKQAPIILAAQAMLQQWEQNDEEVVNLWKQMNSWVYDGFNRSYERMGVDFDQYFYESQTYLLGKDIVEEGLEKGVFFKKDNGSVWADLSQDGLDEKLVLRGDGTSVYMTQDLGTADLKYEHFPFNKSVYVVGNEQDYHFEVLFKILDKLGRPYAKGMHHLSYGMVDLPTGKMKSREGTVVDADDLMEEMVKTAEKHTLELGKIDGFSAAQAKNLYELLGLGALKYFLLKVDPKKRMLFNPEESIEFQGNTGPFIQYTHARVSAILRKAAQLDLKAENIVIQGISELHDAEQKLIQLLSEFPVKVAVAAQEYSPSIIAQYAYDLAKEYNRFYAELSVFNESDHKARGLRIVLSANVAKTIKTAMSLLGVTVPDRM